MGLCPIVWRSRAFDKGKNTPQGVNPPEGILYKSRRFGYNGQGNNPKEFFMNQQIEAFWQRFLEHAGLDSSLRYLEAFHFCLSEEPANRLLQLVLDGKKRATSSAVRAYGPDEPAPKAGDYSIVTDWAGVPRCVIRTVAVMMQPFRDYTFDIVRREGEDDSLKSWRNNHEDFFRRDGAQGGYPFSWDMPVLFEDFEVIYTGDNT